MTPTPQQISNAGYTTEKINLISNRFYFGFDKEGQVCLKSKNNTINLVTQEELIGQLVEPVVARRQNAI